MVVCLCVRVHCVVDIPHPRCFLAPVLFRGFWGGLVGCFGGHCVGETPGSIPNPEAKLNCADGTALGRVWESRTPPNYSYRLLAQRCAELIAKFHSGAAFRSLAESFSAVIALGKRPVPFRTRKLSPTAPMVLHSGGCGRVGRRRNYSSKTPVTRPGFSFCPETVGGPVTLPMEDHFTHLLRCAQP